jgi:hypothetical protein
MAANVARSAVRNTIAPPMRGSAWRLQGSMQGASDTPTVNGHSTREHVATVETGQRPPRAEGIERLQCREG